MLDVQTTIIAVIVTFVIFAIIGWKTSGVDKKYSAVLDVIVEHFIDERSFKVSKLKQYLDMPEDKIKKVLNQLIKEGLLQKSSGGWYKLKDPLVFLTDKDYNRAIRITRDDDILYGAYQNPYFLHVYFLGIYGLFILDVVFVILVYLDLIPGIRETLAAMLPYGDAILPVFLLFLVAVGIIIVDALDNLITAWSRERYSVVIGKLSGISYDRSLSDELSGRITRGQIAGVDINMSGLQKLANYFMEPPVGDIVIKVRGHKKPIVFKNMPYPREMFFVIRSVMLGSLGWRKRHARTLMLWKAKGMMPSIQT